MANERINQIPTTATSFASDDYLPIDGTTNGTRKILGSPILLKDSNNNITVNNVFEGFSTITASGTTVTLTIASPESFVINGSGGQVIKLPDATTLSNGTDFLFNNNQSSGTVTVQNNSGTTVCTLQSGSYITVILLTNSTAAGSWDYHNLAPSNASWSTNTLNWAGAANFQTLSTTGNAVLATSSGSVGVGTNSPATKLEISNGAITAGNSGDVLFGRINSTYPNSGGGYFKLGTNNGDANNGGISIYTLSTATLYERMRIDQYGQTMLGTTFPVATGSGSLTIGGTTASTNTTSGALTVSGGVGIAGNIWAGTSSGSSYINVNRAFSNTGQVGYTWNTGSSANWVNYLAANSNDLAWYSSVPVGGATVMYLSSYGALTVYNYDSASSVIKTVQEQAGSYVQSFLAYNNGGSYYFAGFYNSGGTPLGSIISNGTITSYNTTSDKRLKSSLTPWSLGDKFDQLLIGQFTWKESGITGYGILAQDLYEIYPDAVTKGDNADMPDSKKIESLWQVDYGKLTIPLIAEVQALRKRVAKLEAA